MNFKTIFVIIITALITIFLMLNNQPVDFNLIFTTQTVSKLVVIGVCFVLGFVVGIMVARPKKKSLNLGTQNPNFSEPVTPQKTISEEDENYIS